MKRGSLRLAVLMAAGLSASVSALGQTGYSYPQLRTVRQIASATAMAELCGAGISRGRTISVLRSAGLTEADFEGPVLRDERAKQRIALVQSYEALSMTAIGRSEALHRQCTNLARFYGPRGSMIPGLAILSRR